MSDYKPPLFSFNGSSSRVFGVAVFGRRDNAWWHRAFIMPIYRAGRKLRDWKYEIFYRVHPEHQYHLVRTGLKPGYYDADYLMLHACFALLCRYVEDENDGVEALERWGQELMAEPDKHAPEGLQSAQGVKEGEAVTLYRWWKVKRPADLKRKDELTHLLFSPRRNMFIEEDNGLHRFVPPKWNGSEEVMYDELRALEETIDRQEQEMLHRLIDIREGLWT